MRGLTTVAWLLVALGAVWVGAIVFAPIGIASSSTAARACALATYAAGTFVCHQIPARSFHLAGQPFAVCGRCTGLYVSALAGGFAALVTWRRLPIDDRWLLAMAAVPTALSWTVEHVGIAAQSNAIRAAAALPLGFAGAWVVIGLLVEKKKRRSYKLPSAV
ncbi:MAG TPA: DUF2085 domain-containing protein [Vicinamibacterales bacterium]|nr:DUF2085 domain-containing protein [Vicinamibacterales bacterium]